MPNPPQLRYPELLATIATGTVLPAGQVRRVCNRVLLQSAELIQQDEGFTSRVLSFKAITRSDQRRFARLVRRLPPAQ
jgi:hypothetical protein